MPRLQGQGSNTPMIIGIVVAVLLVALVALELLGTINLINGFGAA